MFLPVLLEDTKKIPSPLRRGKGWPPTPHTLQRPCWEVGHSQPVQMSTSASAEVGIVFISSSLRHQGTQWTWPPQRKHSLPLSRNFSPTLLYDYPILLRVLAKFKVVFCFIKKKFTLFLQEQTPTV